MIYVKQAILKAKEGGYVTGFMYDKLVAVDPLNAVEILFLDPKWWSSLGKALGWNKDKTFEEDGMTLISWKREWHKLIDHLSTGADAESFFKSLLEK